MRILVTGGAGFIGSNLIKGLNREGETDIYVVDNLEPVGKYRNLNALRFADLFDKRDFLSILPRLGKFDAIFHQGACSSTTESNGRYMMEWNYDFSKVLLHTAIEDRASFIYASSAAVYGDGGQGFREELACEWPLNVYGFSKYAFDNYVRRLAPTPASNVVGLRYFNVYGPQETHKKNMSSVIYHFFQSYCAGQPLSLFEGSDQFLRDFVYVDDVVEVNLFCLRQRVSGTFNCGTGQARSFFDLASLVAARLGNTAIQQVPFPLDLAGKYQKYTQADISRLRRAGYGGDFTSLEEGVAKYLECLTARGGYLER